ncbi:MAG: glycoside hydrolase family 75 protein [Luteolibacter sp.]
MIAGKITLVLLTLSFGNGVGQVFKEESVEQSPVALRKSGTQFGTISIKRPEAVSDFRTLLELNSKLPVALADIESLVERGTVSKRFDLLFDEKAKHIKRQKTLDALSNYNYYDCATIMDLVHPETGRRALLIQAGMDVVTDGSDPDRAGDLEDYHGALSSNWFQPYTGYVWGRSKNKNPFANYYDDRISELVSLKAEVDQRNQELPTRAWRMVSEVYQEEINHLSRVKKDNSWGLSNNPRSVVAALDPIIVLPRNWFGKNASISHGDYALVVYGDRVFPTMVAEAGPTYKIGEASLRLAREINKNASGTQRAVDAFSVTYVVFPGTRKATRSEPDVLEINAKVRSLIDEIGGLGDAGKFEAWER